MILALTKNEWLRTKTEGVGGTKQTFTAILGKRTFFKITVIYFRFLMRWKLKEKFRSEYLSLGNRDLQRLIKFHFDPNHRHWMFLFHHWPQQIPLNCLRVALDRFRQINRFNFQIGENWHFLNVLETILFIVIFECIIYFKNLLPWLISM